MNNQVKNFDLKDRCGAFSKTLINVIKLLPKNSVNNPLVEQCIRSGCAVGANYCEANESESRADFIHKLGICKKEAKETQYWIELIAHSNPTFKEDLRKLWKECNELLLIFSKSTQTARANSKH